MELALYEPELGYYRAAVERPGRSRRLPDRRRTPTRSSGRRSPASSTRSTAGSGRRRGSSSASTVPDRAPSASPILQALAGEGRLGAVAGSPDLARAIRYAPIEINPHRRTELVRRHRRGRVRPGRSSSDRRPTAPETGAVVANEFLDALPVHRLVGRAGGIRELLVDWRRTTASSSSKGAPSTPGPGGSPGRRRRPARGGRPGRGLPGARRLGPRGRGRPRARGRPGRGLRLRGGRAVRRRSAPAGPCAPMPATGSTTTGRSAVGRQDLTAHVDFTALERAARPPASRRSGGRARRSSSSAAGWTSCSRPCGPIPATTIDDWLAVRSAVRRLLDPRALGGFRVALPGRGIEPEPPLRGLAYRFDR